MRVEESGCDLEVIGTLARTGYEQDEKAVSETICAAPVPTTGKMRESVSAPSPASDHFWTPVQKLTPVRSKVEAL